MVKIWNLENLNTGEDKKYFVNIINEKHTAQTVDKTTLTIIIAARCQLPLPQLEQLCSGMTSSDTVRFLQFWHWKNLLTALTILMGWFSALHSSDGENHLYLHWPGIRYCKYSKMLYLFLIYKSFWTWCYAYRSAAYYN